MASEVITVQGYVGNSRITKLYAHPRAPYERNVSPHISPEVNASSMHIFNADQKTLNSLLRMKDGFATNSSNLLHQTSSQDGTSWL